MSDDIAAEIAALTTQLQAMSGESQKAVLKNVRAPSMAAQLTGYPRDITPTTPGAGSAYLKAALGAGYVPGQFLTALADAGDRDAERQAAGKAVLASLGLRRAEIPDMSSNKATLGATGATGGYVLPNNLVDTVQKPHVAAAIWSNLITMRSGINVRGVDGPYRLGAPARMQFQDWGTTKENVSETYGSYTSNLGTMARVIDIGKQYARFSAGAAEADVMDELTKAAALGENYYILAGAGTGSVGTGDPTTGIYTALAAVFGAYTTTFSGASNSTIAGAAATGLSQAFGTMATRSRFPTAVVMDAVTYYKILAQGSDTAGFWLSPAAGGLNLNPANGQLRMWDCPIYFDPNFDTNTNTVKRAIALDGSAFRAYRGLEFRVESSDTAGTRFDQNLIGYRGESELGFQAWSGVFVGAAQLIVALIP